jgi:hypothetical protein
MFPEFSLCQVLVRKMDLRSQCGPPHAHKIYSAHISKELMCAMRVTLLTEKELDSLCPPAVHWSDGQVYSYK